MTDSDNMKPRKTPCASCPYRKNVPSGVWDESEYEKLPQYDGDIPEQTTTSIFMCHQQDGCICSGWFAHREPTDLLAVRLGLAMGRLDPSVLDYTTDVPLFESGAAAAEHGMKDIMKPSENAGKVIRKMVRKQNIKVRKQNIRTDPTDSTKDE